METKAMEPIERMGATTDYMQAYDRGVRVGHAEAAQHLAEWMIARSYVTGHGDDLASLLGELDFQLRE